MGVDNVLFGVSRFSLTVLRSAGTMGPIVESRRGIAVSGCWTYFKECYLAVGGVLPGVTRPRMTSGNVEVFLEVFVVVVSNCFIGAFISIFFLTL